MSVLSNCRFLLVSSVNELIDPLQEKLNAFGVLHFEKCLMIKLAKNLITKSYGDGHVFQYIIVDEDSGTEEEALSLFNHMNALDKYNKTKFIFIKSSVDDSSSLGMKSALELEGSDQICFYSKPLDPKLLIKDLESMYSETYSEEDTFIDSIQVDDCIIYRMAAVIDRTVSREMERIMQNAVKKQNNTLIFNFKNTTTFPKSEMKHISQLVLKSQKEYPFIHTTSFTDSVVADMRKGGFTQVFDIKTSFKDLVSKYKIDPQKIKEALSS